jgi:hypothetical protein
VKILRPGDTGLEFMIAPAEDGMAVSVTVVLMPTLDCAMAPTWLIERYGDGLVSGVLAYLLGMASKPWYDPKSALRYFSDWRSAIGDARSEVMTKRGPAVTLRVPEFF